jgi:preprotein translocase subunit YajC
MYNLAWAMGAPVQQQTGSGQGGALTYLMQFAPLILIFAVFYLLLIRPQQKKQRAVQEMIENLKKGDKVITTGGMYATVVDIKEKTVLLKIGDNGKVEFLKNAIAGLQKSSK